YRARATGRVAGSCEKNQQVCFAVRRTLRFRMEWIVCRVATAGKNTGRGIRMATVAVQSGLQLYLKQINESPLLTAVQEKELARRIIQTNDPEAREIMVRSNLRLVVNLAKHYINRGLSLPDLIEEGNIGLLKAVEGFDPNEGTRFSTYASWWIKQAIKRALINSVQPIHIPAYMVEMMAKMKHATRELEDVLGRLPSIDELSIHMQMSPKKLKIIRKAIRAVNTPTQSGSADGELTIND